MFETLQVLGWGFLLRAAQATVDAAPTLVCGLLVAGVLRRMVGPAAIHRLFGSGTWSELPRAWALGMLLPVCSLGVIPVIRELRRAGLRTGTILAFALSAPLLNPLSLLYGLTLSEPLVIFAFILGSLVVSLGAGLVWTHWFAVPGDEPAPEPEPAVPPGLKRMLAVIFTAAREFVSPTLAYWLIGLVGVGLISIAIPFGSLQTSMHHHDVWAPVQMALIILPAYIEPMHVMMILGLMFEHGNSVGAAYVMLVVGAGTNLGMLAWVGWTYGFRRLLPWLVVVMGLTLALGYASEHFLYFAPKAEEHTHAFDDFASPFPADSLGIARAHFASKLADRAGLFQQTALEGLAVLGLTGLVLRLVGTRPSRDQWVEQAATVAPESLPFWNRPLPPSVLGGFALIGLLVFACVGAYLYYPDPKTVFEEMKRVRADAVSAVRSGSKEEAFRHLRHWDDLTRKLQVGVVLRHGGLADDARQSSEDLRERLEDVRDALKDGHDAEARAKLTEVEEAYRRCREAYQRF